MGVSGQQHTGRLSKFGSWDRHRSNGNRLCREEDYGSRRLRGRQHEGPQRPRDKSDSTMSPNDTDMRQADEVIYEAGWRPFSSL